MARCPKQIYRFAEPSDHSMGLGVQFLVKVSRKGQVTLPKEVREALAIREDDYLVLRVEDGRVVLEKPSIPEPGEPVGEDEYRRLIEELEELRREWR